MAAVFAIGNLQNEDVQSRFQFFFTVHPGFTRDSLVFKFQEHYPLVFGVPALFYQ